MTELQTQLKNQEQPVVSGRGLALAVYILYLAGFLTVVTALVGVIIAHVKASSASEAISSHFRFQIRTFWIGLLYLMVGSLLFYFLIGIAVLIWWFIWTIIRVIKGIILLNDGKPIARPKSWLFG